MNAVDQVSGFSEYKRRDGLRIPTKGQLHGPWLCRGEKVSVFYDRLKPFYWPEHYHQQAELFLTFEAASAEVIWRGHTGRAKTQPVAEHQFCLIAPGMLHSCQWKRSADIVVVYIEEALLKEYVNKPLDSIIVGDFRPLTRLDACLWSLGAMFHDLCHEKEETPPASFIEGIGTALACRTLEQYFHGGSREAAIQPRLSSENVQRIVDYIDGQLPTVVTVKEMAKRAGVCARHFGRLLKSATGSSPQQFILKYRVEKALELLRSGKLRVAEAACEVGFCDQSHFDRNCRKFFGFPPRELVAMSESFLKMSETSKIGMAEIE